MEADRSLDIDSARSRKEHELKVRYEHLCNTTVPSEAYEALKSELQEKTERNEQLSRELLYVAARASANMPGWRIYVCRASEKECSKLRSKVDDAASGSGSEATAAVTRARELHTMNERLSIELGEARETITQLEKVNLDKGMHWYLHQ